MEVDPKCLLADLGSCDAVQMVCRFFCKPSTNTTDCSSLLGCKTQMESILLHYGKLDMNPCNIEEYGICNNHSEIKRSSTFKNCCLCKWFGRAKSSKSDLRSINKSYAIAAWQTTKCTYAFARKMCTKCRHELSKVVNTESFKKKCDEHFQWLYDTNIVHTPSTSSCQSQQFLSGSLNSLVIEDEQTRLKKFLQGNVVIIK